MMFGRASRPGAATAMNVAVPFHMQGSPRAEQRLCIIGPMAPSYTRATTSMTGSEVIPATCRLGEIVECSIHQRKYPSHSIHGRVATMRRVFVTALTGGCLRRTYDCRPACFPHLANLYHNLSRSFRYRGEGRQHINGTKVRPRTVCYVGLVYTSFVVPTSKRHDMLLVQIGAKVSLSCLRLTAENS